MTGTPTPNEARSALRDIEQRRGQTVDAGGWHRGWWIAAGVVTVAFGIAVDLAPGALGGWGTTVPIVLLALAALSTTRWGGSAIGRPLRPRQPAGPGRWVAALVGGLLIALLTLVAGRWNVPHLAAVIGVVGGLLLAFAGPWWQHRVLTRRAAQP